MRRRTDVGQATVEFALVLPVVILAMVVLVQVAVFVRAQVLVVHAAREGARAAAVDPDPSAVEQAVRESGPLDPARLSIERSERGEPGSRVTVRVHYLVAVVIPMVRRYVDPLTVSGQTTMRVER
jgi:hypothetical protein